MNTSKMMCPAILINGSTRNKKPKDSQSEERTATQGVSGTSQRKAGRRRVAPAAGAWRISAAGRPPGGRAREWRGSSRDNHQSLLTPVDKPRTWNPSRVCWWCLPVWMRGKSPENQPFMRCMRGIHGASTRAPVRSVAALRCSLAACVAAATAAAAGCWILEPKVSDCNPLVNWTT